MSNRRIVFWLFVGSWYVLQIVNAQNGPQPCPENPIVLTGSDFAQFVYSPYDEQRKYPPNTDCRFILVARTLQRRIHIKLIESQLEEPLFTDCKDYVSVRDGALPTSQEIIRWCGSSYPPALSSSGDSLYIHFHSDNIIQSRGFNLSFVDYVVPGCPPGWITEEDSKYCYWLHDSITGYTFVDAQKVCNYERANLLTVENSEEYDFVYGQYSTSHSFPWIGYSDANKEGIFDPIDPNVHTWPENFPTFKGEHLDKDCVFMDWNIRESVAYTIADCRSRHSLICKKRKDGSTIPIQLSSTLIRYGFQTSSFNYTLLLIILIILIIMLIILWIIYQKCKRSNVVEAVGQRAPVVAETGQRKSETKVTKSSENDRAKPKTMSTDAVKRIINIENQYKSPAAEAALQKAINEVDQGSLGENNVNRRDSDHAYNGSNSPRIRTNANQPIPSDQDFNNSQDFRHETHIQISENLESDQLEQHEVQQRETDLDVHQITNEDEEEEPKTPRPEQPPDRSHLYIEKEDQTIKVIPASTQQKPTNGSTQLHSVLAPVGEPIHREKTDVTGISSTRSRASQFASQNFERPHVGPLDNVSAISLDEFWTK